MKRTISVIASISLVVICTVAIVQGAPLNKGDSAELGDPATGMEFVNVPGSCFQMGDTFGIGFSREKPAHDVCVSDFRIGKYEVTQGQWKMVMGSNPSNFSSCGDDCPVEQVSWDDVQVFIRKLNILAGKSYRLPTEVEWEYAARSGGKLEKYSGSDRVDGVAWYSGNSGFVTHPAGQKQPNGLGIYDMSGNVWEWVSDMYTAYPANSAQDSGKPASDCCRVYRGGGWGSDAWSVRASLRYNYLSGTRSSSLGFRLASPVP